MRNFGIEPIKFEDVFCQLCDLTKPRRDGFVTLPDLLHPERVKLTGVFFSCMWNWGKLAAFDGREPMLVKQEPNYGPISQWDRYASHEYARLANEEEETNNAAQQQQQPQQQQQGAAGLGVGGGGGGMLGLQAGMGSLGLSDATTASIIGASHYGGGGGGGGGSGDFGASFGGAGSQHSNPLAAGGGGGSGGFGGAFASGLSLEHPQHDDLGGDGDAGGLLGEDFGAALAGGSMSGGGGGGGRGAGGVRR
jgi:hypothetical protein